jgi:hypothetical protein
VRALLRVAAVLVLGVSAGASIADVEAPHKPTIVKPGTSVRAVLPDPGKDAKPRTLVFALEARAAGPVTIEARSLDFDITLKVSLLDAPVDAPALKFDDDSGIATNSRIDLDAGVSSAYRIEVGSTGSWGGEFELSVTKGRVPELSSATAREKNGGVDQDCSQKGAPEEPHAHGVRSHPIRSV